MWSDDLQQVREKRRGYRPTIDRADELCRALGIKMTIGKTPTGDEVADVAGEDDERPTDQ